MAYHFHIDKENRKLHFAIYTSLEEQQMIEDDFWEENDDEESKPKITKFTMMEEYLLNNKSFFTIQRVSDLLDISRDTLERAIWSEKTNEQGEKKYPNRTHLRCYKVDYYFAPNGTKDRTLWKELKGSNLSKLIHIDDLKDFLFNSIDSSYSYRYGSSVIWEPIKDKLEDAFHRKVETSPLSRKQNFLTVLKHERTSSQIKELINEIIYGQVVLRSKVSLKEIYKKSDTIYDRLAKCLNVVRFKFLDAKRATPRYIFSFGYEENKEYEENEEEIEEFIINKNKIIEHELSELARMVSKNKVKIIPMQHNLKTDFEFKEFEEAMDYLSLYLQGYKRPPTGYYAGNDGREYFAVDARQTRLFGKIIDVEIKKQQMEKERARLARKLLKKERKGFR